MALLAQFQINFLKTGVAAQIISELLLLVPNPVISQINVSYSGGHVSYLLKGRLEGLLTQQYNLAALQLELNYCNITSGLIIPASSVHNFLVLKATNINRDASGSKLYRTLHLRT